MYAIVNTVIHYIKKRVALFNRIIAFKILRQFRTRALHSSSFSVVYVVERDT